MTIESVSAAQDCREHLGISEKKVSTVKGYVKGVEHSITITIDHNKIEFGFDKHVVNFLYFNTDWQEMEWNKEEKVLTISNKKPKYSFGVMFPEP